MLDAISSLKIFSKFIKNINFILDSKISYSVFIYVKHSWKKVKCFKRIYFLKNIIFCKCEWFWFEKMMMWKVLTKFLKCSTASKISSWWPNLCTPKWSRSSGRRFKSCCPLTSLLRNEWIYNKTTLSSPKMKCQKLYGCDSLNFVF